MKFNRDFEESEYIRPITGKEFRETGALFLINQTLHLLGMAIIWDQETDELKAALCKFRGFAEKQTDEGYAKVTKYLRDNIKQIGNDVEYEGDCENCFRYINKDSWYSCNGDAFELDGSCKIYIEGK